MVASDVNKNFDKEIPASRKNQYQGKKNNTKEKPIPRKKKQHQGNTKEKTTPWINKQKTSYARKV
tara:strand:- start:271 stop:465 length:195 start_codon:yes stop_codon:yes gene_type:complete